MVIKRLLSLLLPAVAGLQLCAASAPAAPPRPRLVVAIVVDQLRTDYIDYLRPLMGHDGFMRLEQGGVYMRDVEFAPARLDAVSSTAMIFTGAAPAQSGVTAGGVWNESALRVLPVFHDPATVGVNTTLTLSPAHMSLSTVSDELMIDGAGLAMVQSIAADPQVALAMAGHAGTGAVWISGTDGRWATTSYYKELPAPAANANYRRPLSARVDTMQWKPLLPLDRYPGLPAQKRQYEFRHTFPSRSKEVYELLAASPKGNEEVTSLAIEYLKSLQMGRRGDTIDMLCLGYTAAPFRAVKDGDYRIELQDTYLRLDLQLGRLLKTIDSMVGIDNCVIMLTGTGYYDDAVPPDARYRIPTGDFSTKRAMALLNGFFAAKYGQGNYVHTYAGGGFHIDVKGMEKRGVNIGEALAAAKEFMMKMSGVSNVYTLPEILSPDDDATHALALCTDARTAPQLTVQLTPGWNLVQDHIYPVTSTPVRMGAISTPAFLFAPGLVGHGRIDTAVDARALAPTLTSMLHMRAPNGASLRPIIMP